MDGGGSCVRTCTVETGRVVTVVNVTFRPGAPLPGGLAKGRAEAVPRGPIMLH